MYIKQEDLYVPRNFEGVPDTHYRFIKRLDIERSSNIISPFSSHKVSEETDFFEEAFQPLETGYYLASAQDLHDEYLVELMLDHLEQTDNDFYPPLSTYFNDFLAPKRTKRESLLQFVKDREDFSHLLVIKRDEVFYKPENPMLVDGVDVQDDMVSDFKDTVIGFTSYKPNIVMTHPETEKEYKTFLIRTTSIIPSHRNLGIAKRLYHHLEYVLADFYAKEHGVEVILRRTWSTNNTQIHLYTKTGFNLWYKEINGRSEGVHNMYYAKYLKEAIKE